MFQRSIGKQNIERQLDKLAQDPKAIDSLAQMQRDINGGLRGNYEPEDYYHIMRIEDIFDKARKKAWASIMNDPRIQALRNKRTQSKVNRFRKKRQTQQIEPLFNMYK